MGFFKDISLDVHAHALATLFAQLRAEQFSCILANLENVLGLQMPAAKKKLGGDAELSLKALQYWILMTEIGRRGYVSAAESDKFNGMAMKHGWSDQREEMSRRLLEIGTHKNDPFERTVDVVVPIGTYLFGECNDPRAWTVMGSTIPPFSIQTQIVIAKEFGDKEEEKKLQLEFEAVCRDMQNLG